MGTIIDLTHRAPGCLTGTTHYLPIYLICKITLMKVQVLPHFAYEQTERLREEKGDRACPSHAGNTGQPSAKLHPSAGLLAISPGVKIKARPLRHHHDVVPDLISSLSLFSALH